MKILLTQSHCSDSIRSKLDVGKASFSWGKKKHTKGTEEAQSKNKCTVKQTQASLQERGAIEKCKRVKIVPMVVYYHSCRYQLSICSKDQTFG